MLCFFKTVSLQSSCPSTGITDVSRWMCLTFYPEEPSIYRTIKYNHAPIWAVWCLSSPPSFFPNNSKRCSCCFEIHCALRKCICHFGSYLRWLDRNYLILEFISTQLSLRNHFKNKTCVMVQKKKNTWHLSMMMIAQLKLYTYSGWILWYIKLCPNKVFKVAHDLFSLVVLCHSHSSFLKNRSFTETAIYTFFSLAPLSIYLVCI